MNVPTGSELAGPILPARQPWGLTVAYVVDPSGVLWRVIQP